MMGLGRPVETFRSSRLSFACEPRTRTSRRNSSLESQAFVMRASTGNRLLSRRRKFRSPKMNLNAFFMPFSYSIWQIHRILDQVSKIRRFHSIPFEFQGFENRPQICFLPFRILYCKPILRDLSLLVCGL